MTILFLFSFFCWNKNQRKSIFNDCSSVDFIKRLSTFFPRDPRKYSFWCKNNHFSFARFALMQSNICIYFTRNRRAWLYDGDDDDESLVIVVLSLSFYSFFARTSFYRLNHPILSEEQVSIANSIELFIIIRFFLFFFLILFFSLSLVLAFIFQYGLVLISDYCKLVLLIDKMVSSKHISCSLWKSI